MKNYNIIILTMLISITSFGQVGIGTSTPDAKAALHIDGNKKSLLLPRMESRPASPAVGLMIYNTSNDCIEYYNGDWQNICDWDNTAAAGKTISITSCNDVTGTTLNDDPATPLGTEYDWTEAPDYMGGTTTRALVEIGGQCWFGRNSNTPSPYTGTNSFDGYYNNDTSEPVVGEGRLYQWDAAMNGSDTERAQGVCPTGWHVPSDCEWMYLENSLGMSTTDQETDNGLRRSGSVGSKLKSGGSSGFTALLAGGRSTDGEFVARDENGVWWCSSGPSTILAQRRFLLSNQAGVYRASGRKAFGFSVRCLKD